MITPVTSTLDQWNSDSDAVPAGWEETRRVLETAELFWISTVRPTGGPMSRRWSPYGWMTRFTFTPGLRSRSSPTSAPTRTWC